MKKFLFYFALIGSILMLFMILKPEKVKEVYINVEIKGAVSKPGVYELNENSIVSDLINKAGGLLNDADISVTNLAKKLKDEMVVIIYTNEEINSLKTKLTAVKYIDKECVCPKITNNACIDEVIYNYDDPIVTEGKVSLNSATLEELTTLPGIGEGKAKAIIEYRDNNNGFKSIEEIKEVKGIGESLFEKIKDYLIL